MRRSERWREREGSEKLCESVRGREIERRETENERVIKERRERRRETVGKIEGDGQKE